MNASALPSGLLTPHEVFRALAPDARGRAEAYRELVLQGMAGDVTVDDK
jgi:hypothetical protein